MMKAALAADPAAASWTFQHGAGCAKCGRTGYRGRSGIFEFMEVSDPIREMILNETGTVALRQKAIELGMETLLVNGMGRVRRGLTTVEEVMSVAPTSDMG
jgi:type IV pilus assembly protein PilB